jgi:OmcA/MtrC family decaheme c-type cytochrome
MRIPASVFALGRVTTVMLLAACCWTLSGAPDHNGFTPRDKAYYASLATMNFVRPGLKITIVSSNIAPDGTISVDYQITDPQGQPLDAAGITTPGAVSVSFCAAFIPKGQTQFYSYTTRVQTSPITKASATQAGTDSGGTSKQVADGEYVYTFKTKAAGLNGAAWDPTVTHRMGVYGSRNLTEFDLGTNYASTTFDWVPAGGKVTATRDVIRTASCNKCHDRLAFHGGSRQGMDLCIMCHQPQTIDPDTGNTVDMKVLGHKIHMGSQLPSVQAGTPYQIIGFNQAVSDWSTVVLPSDPRRCTECHEDQSVTGATQSNNWLTSPSRAACGACHDNVNFATGLNHVNLPQADDNQCATCHIPQGELEFDASIRGAHTVPSESATRPGLVLTLLKVDNGVAGKAPTVTFTSQDYSGNPVPPSTLTVSPNRIALVMAGPASDYGYTSFGSDVTTPGYVSENPATAANCDSGGTCTYTFTHSIPANATGTYAIGIEGRRGITLLPNTTRQQSSEYGAINKVIYFSVDGTPVTPRRQVVDTAKCNMCHVYLSLHGENRNRIEMCVLCHNPSENDVSTRSSATVASDQGLPPQSVNFALMVHKIHTGENMQSNFNRNYIIVGFGGSRHDFGMAFASVPASIPNTGVRYPTMGPTGTTGDTAKCDLCHVNRSEANLPIGKNAVLDTQGPVSPAAATTSACTACHQNVSALSHAISQTDPKFGESCDVCHGTGAAFDVAQVHAGQ